MLQLNSIKQPFLSWKEPLVSFLVILACLLLFLKLPVDNFFQEICKDIFFLVIIPILYIKIILKKSLADFGFNIPEKKSSVFWAIGVLVFSLLIFIILIKLTNFKINYHISRNIQASFGNFLFYELVTFNFLFLFQEFFFKGFILFSFSPKLRAWSVLLVPTLYCFSLFLEKSFNWQAAPLILFSFFGSWLAYKNNSFWISYITGLVFIILLESFLIFILK